METAAASALYEQLHKAAPYHDGSFTRWSAERTIEHPYHFRDGVTIWAAPLNLAPHDTFLTDPAAPVFPRGGDAGGKSA